MIRRLSLIFLLIISLHGFSQTGPGGVGNSSDNGLWLKADDIVGSNGSNVPLWNDRSGNGIDAYQTTSSRNPLFYNNSSMNNQPVVRLDGVDDQLVIDDAYILDTGIAMTYIVAIRPNNLNNSARGILGKRITYTNPSEYAYTWFFYHSNNLFLDINTQNNRFNTSTAFSNATNYILSFEFDGTQPSSSRSKIFSENNLLRTASESSTHITNSNQQVVIGALNVDYGTYLGADYGDIIHYNRALNQVERIIVNNYLSAKYNIPLSGNDLYKQDEAINGNYDYEVAGIGRIDASNQHTNSRGSSIIRIFNPRNLGNNEFLMWGHNNDSLVPTETTDIPSPLTARWKRVWRVSELNTLGSAVNVGNIDMEWDLSGMGSVNAAHLRLLIDTDNDGSFADETPIAGAVNTSGSRFTFNNVSGISNARRFTLGTINSTATPLPIELLSFNAKMFHKSVLLKWLTATEINNDYFEIEHSINAIDWNTLDKVKGAGTSSSQISYTFLHHHPIDGDNYYRLKQTDFDGSFSYSDIQAISKEKNNLNVIIYPNPADQIASIDNTDSFTEIQIFTINGKSVDIPVEVKQSQIEINTSSLENGTYIIRISDSYHGIVETKKLIVQH